MSGLEVGVRGELAAFVERVERLNEEKVALGEDIKLVFAEAAAAGFDVPTMRKVIKARSVDADDRAEQLALFDLYMHALGLMPDGIADDATLAADRARRKAAADPKKSKARKATREAEADKVVRPTFGGDDRSRPRFDDDGGDEPGGRKH